MKTPVTIESMKIWLRLPPDADAELDANLSSLLIAASTHIGDLCGMTLVVPNDGELPDVPEKLCIAIKFLVAEWFENPVADSQVETGSRMVIDSLISRYKVYSYPDHNAVV